MRRLLVLLGISGWLLGSVGMCQAQEEGDSSDELVSFQPAVPPQLTARTPSFGQPAVPSASGLAASQTSRASGFTTQLKDSWYWYLKQSWGFSRSEETSSKPK